MRRLIHLLLILVLATPLPATSAVPRQDRPTATVQRIALVIGNGRYQHLDQLPNPANDARAVAAAQNDGSARVSLGIMARDGRGVPQDYARAVRWYRAAAGQGFAHAEARLGKLHEAGQGVSRGYGEALKRYRRAGAQGEVWSHRYGRLHETGEGVPKDHAQAVHWYRIAAERGNAWAQRDLGRMYEAGRGVERDLAEAAIWYARAAGQDDAKARELSLGRLNGLPEAARVAAAERLLIQAGRLQGPADGRLDPSTQTAIQVFQRTAGLSADGGLSADLLVALGRQVGPAGPGPEREEL